MIRPMHPRPAFRPVALLLLAALVAGLLPACAARPDAADSALGPSAVRVAQFNIRDLRLDEIRDADSPRMREIIEIVQRLDADILLVNELEYDGSRTLAGRVTRPPRSGAELARRFAEDLGLDDAGPRPIRYDVFQAPSNTGIHSGLDLNRDGIVTTEPGSRAYGNDCLGFGEFPGHYAMALFVREGFTIDHDAARTFMTFRWIDLPSALLPPGDGEFVPEDRLWHTPAMLDILPLSSKSHWDVPVRTPAGDVIRILASHPTPPVFDGPEDRNGRRNHDEIRFWAEYIDGAAFIVDDRGRSGGMPRFASFVIAGDLNADPLRGDSRNNPVQRFILDHPLVDGRFTPLSTFAPPGEPAEATATWGKRVDYVQPSADLGVLRGGVYRDHREAPGHPAPPAPPTSPAPPTASANPPAEAFPSDHFPVWVEIIPAGEL
jgi:hypothetical protein